MSDKGFKLWNRARPYEDLSSLKKYLHSTTGKYDKTDINEYIINATQLTTGTADEIEADDGIAISYIGKTELTLLLAGSADNESTLAKTYTLVYLDQDGVSHTAVGTGTATLNGTPVAFVPAVTDFYSAVSFTASEADANVNVYAATAGITAIYATIATTATSATEANLFGVGAVYIRSHTNHNDADEAEIYLNYCTPWGEQKYSVGIIPAADGTVETRFLEATVEDGVYTAGTTTVKDFYRVIECTTDTTPTANCHEFIITDADCGNVDGSSGDIYGLILEGVYEMVNTRFHARTGYDSWIAQIEAQAITGAALGDAYVLTIAYTPRNATHSKTITISFSNCIQFEKPILLEEATDVTFSIVDTAGATTATLCYVAVEAKRYE